MTMGYEALRLVFAWYCLSAVLYLVQVIGMFFLFKKMGLESWKGLIPFYNGYLVAERTYASRFFWTILVLSFMIHFLNKIRGTDFMDVLSVFSIVLVMLVIVLTLSIRSSYFFAKSFGYDVGMAIGLLCLPFIFVYVLAFDQSEYQGNLFQNSGEAF